MLRHSGSDWTVARVELPLPVLLPGAQVSFHLGQLQVDRGHFEAVGYAAIEGLARLLVHLVLRSFIDSTGQVILKRLDYNWSHVLSHAFPIEVGCGGDLVGKL